MSISGNKIDEILWYAVISVSTNGLISCFQIRLSSDDSSLVDAEPIFNLENNEKINYCLFIKE